MTGQDLSVFVPHAAAVDRLLLLLLCFSTMRSFRGLRRAPAAWLGLALALALLATAGDGHARATGVEGAGAATLGRAAEALHLPDAPALAQHGPTTAAVDTRAAGPRPGGAGRTARGALAAPVASAPGIGLASPADRPEDDARRALRRAGRASAPSTAPPFPSF